ncbi:hypothetical protein BT93_F1241 [Corymbia citriodora subsp. variegata]|nr:hypothetical protein BT93_F1241 [Corymbia citriodora subsp. variegata]
MSSTSRAWIVAATIGTVEALKDQGFCRWNFALRSLHQHAKSNVGSCSQAKRVSSCSAASAISEKIRERKVKQREESLRKVMYLSCWGPY